MAFFWGYKFNQQHDRDICDDECQESDTYFDDLVANATQYISVRGMFEVKNGFKYSELNKSLNPDNQTWNRYDLKVNYTDP